MGEWVGNAIHGMVWEGGREGGVPRVEVESMAIASRGRRDIAHFIARGLGGWAGGP